MFDDQPTGKQGGAVPSNLPTGEPEDIFAGTPIDAESPDVETPMVDDAQVAGSPNSTINSVASALDAGALKPKQQPVSAQPAMDAGMPDIGMGENAQMAESVPNMSSNRESSDLSQAQPLGMDQRGSGQGSAMYERPLYGPTPPPPAPPSSGDFGANATGDSSVLKEPLGSKRVIFFIVVLVVLAVLIGGGAWAYFAFIANGNSETTGTIDTEPVSDFLDSGTDTNTGDPDGASIPPATSTQTTEENIIFGDTIPDTDSDGLDDVREDDIGTDFTKWDTDADGLSDGEEVTIWKTNPLNPDTDDDGFLDGVEVSNGYNPLGSGELFEPPSGNAATTTASSGTNTNFTTSATTSASN